MDEIEKKHPELSISLSLVRRISRDQVEPVKTVRKPGSELEMIRSYNNEIHDVNDPQGV
jgi:hypothetical protein